MPSTETVFLGLTLDSRLKWVSNFNTNDIAARKAFFIVIGCLRDYLGLNKKPHLVPVIFRRLADPPV